MQNYTTIIGIIELRLQKVCYETTQKRYGVGSHHRGAVEQRITSNLEEKI